MTKPDVNKTFNIDARAVEVTDEGRVTAIISAYGVTDRHNTRAPRAFWEKVLAKNPTPTICWNHDIDRYCGRAETYEHLNPGDERLSPLARSGGGLLAEMVFNLDVPDGRNMFAHIKAGDISQWSFTTFNTRYSSSPIDGVSEFIDGELLEISPVLMGSNPATGVVAYRDVGLKLDDHFDSVIETVDNYLERLSDLLEKRSYISANKRNQLEILRSKVDDLLSYSAEARDTDAAKQDDERLELTKRIVLTLLNQDVDSRNSQERSEE